MGSNPTSGTSLDIGLAGRLRPRGPSRIVGRVIMSDMDAAAWGFFGVVVGSLITLGAELIRARYAAMPDSRSSRRLAERDRFQRSTLVELQGALESFARTVLAIGEARDAEASAAGGWQPMSDATLTPDLREANRQANMAITSLSALVLDDEVRRLCQEVLASAAQIWLAQSPEEADRGVAATINAATTASRRCGDVFRESYLSTLDD